MICDSCNVEIPPAWKRVIAENLCPECQGPIMSDQTIELMIGLKEALEKMPNDPQGIAGWLLSHYRLQKIGTGEPTGFIGKKINQNSQNEQINSSENSMKIAQNPLEKFLKNAGIDQNKQKNYKTLMDQINGINSIEDEQKKQLEEEYRSQNDDYLAETEDPEFTKQALKTMISANISKDKMRGLTQDSYSYDSNSNDGFDELHPALQQDRLRRLQKQKDLDLGGIGKIKRSS